MYVYIYIISCLWVYILKHIIYVNHESLRICICAEVKVVHWMASKHACIFEGMNVCILKNMLMHGNLLALCHTNTLT